MPKTKSKLSFTLIELLVVIAIVGILSGLIINTMSGATENARISKGRVYSNSVRDALGNNFVSEWNFDSLTTASNGTAIPDNWGNNIGTLVTNDGATNKIATGEGSCVFGNCISLDGSGDYISFATNDNFNINSASSFTMSIWAKSITSTSSAIITKGRWNTGTAGWILRNASSPQDLYFVFDDGGTNHRQRRLYTGRTFNWKNFVLTVSPTKYIIYVDGVIKYNLTRDFNTTTNDSDLVIGSDSTKASCFLNGAVDEIRFYNDVISLSQIRANYLAGLEKLLANGGITQDEYDQRIAKLNSNYAEK